LTDADFSGANVSKTRFSRGEKSQLKGLEKSKNLDAAIFQ
jgi:uncharacterized protein YjbI with pentapeptide repeats